MKSKHFLAGAALLVASLTASAVDFVEGFDSVAALPASGWVQTNVSAAPENPWFQGNPGIFTSQSGAEDSYAGANYLSSAFGSIDNWLISPLLLLSADSELSFFTRSAGEDMFPDMMQVMFSATGSSDLASFSLLTTIGVASAYPTTWQQFMLQLPDVASGRFAFRQVGSNETSGYVAVDTVRVSAIAAPVPEPEIVLMLAAGLTGLAVYRRRRAAGSKREE